MNWTIWQVIVSPHFAPLVRALASMPDQTVTLVAEREPLELRRAIGWHTPDCSPARVLIKPTDTEVEELIEEGSGQRSVHLVGGFANVALIRRVLPRLAKTGALVGLVSESSDNRGFTGLARRIKHSLDRRRVGRNLDFILAMGQLGVQWFESIGYDPSRVFPFGYVPERPVIHAVDSRERNEGKTFRILYLGQIVRRKDVPTAIRALSRVATGDWRFDIVGSGAELIPWQKIAAESGVGDRIRFRAAVDSGMAGPLIGRADLLLLPSRWDGWGAVVNEALMCGVPVICSDRCGAADLLREPWRGSIFRAGSVKSLRDNLQEWIKRGRRTDETSARIRAWSSALEGPQVARYLVEIINCVQSGAQRPLPPWY